MQVPTVGRIVHYFRMNGTGSWNGPFAAIVAQANDTRDRVGESPPSGDYATWPSLVGEGP